MPIAWLSVAIACTVGYHLVLKLTPAGVNPLLSLLVTYALVTVLFGALLAASPADSSGDRKRASSTGPRSRWPSRSSGSTSRSCSSIAVVSRSASAHW